MFINNWYAACIANELGDTPKQITMLAHDFVLFRDSDNSIHCLSDLCCHRGASLTLGQCKDGGIKCPQHGWEFNGDGKCTFIPAGIKTPQEPPGKARVPSYPVEEKYGLVFVFLGDLGEEERPALPDIMPEWYTDDWHKDVIPRTKDINYMRMSENYNDPTHVHYIHEFAKWLPKGVTIEDKELSDHYVKAWHAAWDAEGNHSVSAGLMMEYDVISCVSRNTNYQPDYPCQIVTAYVTPIDDRNTQIHMIILMPKDEFTALDGSRVRGATPDEHKMLVDMTRDQVMDEDYVVLKTTRPRQAANPGEELLLETDRTIAQVRKMSRDYGDKFGRIDTVALKALEDTHIRVIPCPGHKTEPNAWIHKTVPLQPTAARGNLKAAS
jgi:phenylpropionate dioxygenase-like ring-hydroxylating dioxygenase large terminal subunit